MTDKTETGWIIEKYRYSILLFWTGDRDHFTPDSAQAVRFARQKDAECMLSWHLGGEGRAIEHMWVSK